MDVKLLYVEEFEDKLFKGQNAHPKVGEVYRAVERKADPRVGKVYQMFFDEPGEKINLGMFLPGLEADNKLFKYKLREVTVEDLLDLDVDDSTYERLRSWGPSFADGLEERHLNIPVMNGAENVSLPDIENLANKISDAIANASRSVIEGRGLNKVEDNDPNMHKAVQHLITYLSNSYDDSYESSLLGNPAQKLIFNKSYGKGVNVFNATKYLQRYMSVGHEKSNNPTDVLKAIHYLLYEVKRLLIHGEIEA